MTPASHVACGDAQVMHAAEQALRQLQVSDVERNAILEAFRYKEAKMAAAVKEANARADAVVEEAAAKVVEVGATPFTRCDRRDYEHQTATRLRHVSSPVGNSITT